MRLFLRSLLLAFLTLFPLTASAYEPLAKRFDVDRLLFTKYYAAQFKAAFAGDCVTLLATVKPEEVGWDDPASIQSDPILFRRIFAAVEMYDRGICVPADPERVTRYFQETITVNGYLASSFHLEMAWRAWNGFAMPRNQDLAREHILEGLLQWISSDGPPEELSRHTRSGRPLPEYAREVYNWILDQTSTEEDRIAFGIGLADGKLSFSDGKRLGVRSIAAHGIMFWYNDYSETLYRTALIERSGILGPQLIGNWELPMSSASKCGVIGAMKIMVPIYLAEEEDPELHHYYALQALWRLQQHGYDTEAEMRQIDDRFDMAHFWDYVERGMMPLYGKDTYCNWKHHHSPPRP